MRFWVELDDDEETRDLARRWTQPPGRYRQPYERALAKFTAAIREQLPWAPITGDAIWWRPREEGEWSGPVVVLEVTPTRVVFDDDGTERALTFADHVFRNSQVPTN